MKIDLRIDGKDKRFINDFVAARVFRNALELNKYFLENMNVSEVETFDKIIEFTVRAFGNQFTIDEVWDGLPADKLQSEPMRIFHEVLNLGGLEVHSPIKTADSGNDNGETGK